MSGRHIGAEAALAVGLADRVFPSDELQAAAHEDAVRFAAGPTQAYAAVKRAIRDGFDTDLATGLAIEAEEFATVFATGDAKIGVRAFLDKDKPTFTGS